MKFKNPLKKKEVKDNLFKAINAQLKEEIKAIEKTPDPAGRLARYETLKTGFDSLYGSGQIQSSADRISLDKGDLGFGAFMGAINGAWVSGMTLGILFPPALPAVAAVVTSTALAGRHLVYKSEAKSRGLTTTDVKYAIKTKALKSKVSKAIQFLTLEIEKEKTLENLRQKFKGAVETPVAAEPVVAEETASVETAAPAAPVTSAVQETPAAKPRRKPDYSRISKARL